ncbi:hypothetical protein QE152_g35688 [Popillia japonica]|uniref:Uncharacterized protein n=1 Tax=Popillia japonica TaxID=7064 RepID=A0AAW1IFF9_POPJA
MVDKSDGGSKSGVRKKEFLNKQRSNSLGSTNFSQSEINKIIGIETTKKADGIKIAIEKTQSQKGDISKTDTRTNILQGRSSTLVHGNGDINNGEQDRRETNEDTLINAEEVFKPRNAVMRTPPNIAVQRSNQFYKADANVNVTTKRPRSGSSPREQERNKISKHTSTESNTKSNHGNITCRVPETLRALASDTEDMLVSITNAVETIQSSIFKSPGDSLALNPLELNEIRMATFNLHKTVISLAYKIRRMEMENHKFNPLCNPTNHNANLAQPNERGEGEYRERRHTHTEKTYSEVTRSSRDNSESTRPAWSSPM